MLNQITPLIITYNEEANIAATLDKLNWATRILVIDSGSTDKTLEIIAARSNAVVIHRGFDNFADQCNFGLQQIASPWALSIDADYKLSEDLIAELRRLTPSDATVGYRARFIYRIYGRSLRGALYPPRIVLYRKEIGRYKNEGHGHRLEIAGNVIDLNGVIYHDDRKSLRRWISSQQRYARDEAAYLLELPRHKMSKTDKVRALGWPAPILIFLYTLFVKACVFDGRPGWHYVLQRLCAEVLIALELVDQRLRQESFRIEGSLRSTGLSADENSTNDHIGH
jgi:glycosyltransferase involved in cell wall biosynthesis